jgi:CheY-like chemotaxis protein/HPt (histidine-containing phosphotransfer) domain-containing protein
LLVEDNELNREVASGLLEDAPVTVSAAGNGEVAIRMLNESKYDLLLMDMQMPVMDGLTATRAIRQNSQFKDLPIVAMTANARADDYEKCLQAGMNDYLAKPIDPDKLFEALLRWIPARTSVPNAAAPSVVRAQKSSAERPPLEIPGIDTESALKRTGGNSQRYESLLLRFAESQAGAVDQLRAALKAQDSATAQRIAHSLKGAAANLGANALAAVAGSAEIAIKTQSEIEPALGELDQTLLAAVATIRRALSPAEKVESGLSDNGDPSVILQPLSRLKRLLEADDSEAADFVETQARFSAILSRTEMETLTRTVADFDYESALRAVSGIADRLSLKLDYAIMTPKQKLILVGGWYTAQYQRDHGRPKRHLEDKDRHQRCKGPGHRCGRREARSHSARRDDA